jgi:hypothetical protein
MNSELNHVESAGFGLPAIQWSAAARTGASSEQAVGAAEAAVGSRAPAAREQAIASDHRERDATTTSRVSARRRGLETFT